MSLLKIRYRSKLMCRHVHFNVFLPDDTPEWFLNNNPNYDRPTKTLFLLHGYDGDQDTWIVESDVLNYAYQQNLAVVFPAAENSFYIDSVATGKQYCSFIGKELVEYVRKNFNLAQKREETMIAGFSMGGYGAMHIGLSHPETFMGCAGLSSANIVNELSKLKPGEGNPIANYDYYAQIFGDLSNIKNTTANLEYLYDSLVKENKSIPKIFMACGTEDFLLEPNRQLAKYFSDKKANFEYQEGPGSHNMQFWFEYLPKAVDFLIHKN